MAHMAHMAHMAPKAHVTHMVHLLTHAITSRHYMQVNSSSLPPRKRREKGVILSLLQVVLRYNSYGARGPPTHARAPKHTRTPPDEAPESGFEGDARGQGVYHPSHDTTQDPVRRERGDATCRATPQLLMHMKQAHEMETSQAEPGHTRGVRLGE